MDTQVMRITSNIIRQLYANENLFKLLKYSMPNALDLPNLSKKEKDDLINNEEQKRIYKVGYSADFINDVRSELRIYKAFQPSVGQAKLIIFFDILVHKDIWNLDDGLERADMIFFELKETLCNQEVQGMGKLQFNSPVKPMSYGKAFYGYRTETHTRVEW